MRSEGAPATLAPIPSYAFPESAALALARVTAYGQWRSKPIIPAPALEGVDRDEIRRIIERGFARGAGWALPDEVQDLLAAAGIEASRKSTLPSGLPPDWDTLSPSRRLDQRCFTRASNAPCA